MGDDTEIAVKISAQLEELNKGLSQSVQEIKGACDAIKGQMGGLSEKGKETEGLLKMALSGGIFLEFKEIAKDALEAVMAAFDQTIGKAEEYGLSNAKFARVIGTTVDEAAALANQLDDVGVSTETYERLALQMGNRLGQNEQGFQRLGVTTRDLSGQLLGGKAAMDAVFSAMEKNPANANAIAFEAFGRRAIVAFDIMRAGKQSTQETLDMLHSFGVETGDTSAAAGQLQLNMAELKDMNEALWVALGQKLLPVAIEFTNWLKGPGGEGLKLFGQGLAFVIEEVTWLATTIDKVAWAIALPLAELTNTVGALAILLYDVLTLKWGNIAGDARAAWDQMVKDWQDAKAKMKADDDAYQSVYNALYGPRKPLTGPGLYGSAAPVHGSESDKTAEEARKLADERITAQEKMALERIRIEENADRTMLALGRETEDEAVRQAMEREDQKYNIQRSALQRKAAADVGDKVAHQKDLDDIKLLELKHIEALDQIYAQHVIKKQEMDRKALQDYIQNQQEQLSIDIQDIELAFSRHEITAQQRAQRERQLTMELQREVMKRLDAELATLTPGTEAYRQAYQKRLEISRKFSQDLKQIDTQLQNDERQKWEQLGSSIQGSFNGAVKGMLLGGMTLKQGLGQIIDGILGAFIDMALTMLEQWVATQLAILIFGETTKTTSAVGQITAAAGVAAANTYASVSAIPVVGPFMAPGMAAAAMGTVLSFNSLAFAEKGMLLDQDRLVFAHKDEQILPPHLSRGIQGLIADGKRGGGDNNFNYSPTVYGGGKTLEELLESEGNTMRAWVMARHREGAFG